MNLSILSPIGGMNKLSPHTN